MASRILITQLWQGQSTQPEWKRHPGQVDEATNFALDLTHGARKRSPTRLVADIDSSVLSSEIDYYVETIQGVLVFISDGSIKAINLSGDEITVIDNTGGFAYLDNVSVDDIDTTVSVDTMIICNRNTTLETETTDTFELIGEVDFFSDLADIENPTHGDVYLVIDSENLDPAGYYLYSSSTEAWTRISSSGDSDGKITISTWPHRLVYDSDAGTLTFATIPFNNRLSGNSITNPTFNIVGEKCKSVQFFSGRLAFVGTDSINLTRTGDIFSVFNFNVTNFTDDDRLIRSITIKNIGEAQRSEQLGNSLFIACANGQLEYTTGVDRPLSAVDNLGLIRQIGDLKPLDIGMGTSSDRAIIADKFNDLHIFAWDNATRSIGYAGSTTRHVEGLMADDTIKAIWLDGLTTFITTDTNKVWVHDMYIGSEGLEQSAWSKYTFAFDIKYIDAWNQNIRILSLDGTVWSLMDYTHRAANPPDGFDFDPRLDRRELLNGTYDFNNNWTEFILTRNADIDLVRVVTTKNSDGNDSHEFLTPVSVSGLKVRVQGNWEDYKHYLGWNYTAELILSKIYDGADARPMLSGINILHHDSTNYRLVIGRDGETLRRINWQSFTMSAKKLGATMVQTGGNNNIVLGDARNTVVKIIQDTPGTCTISGIEYKVNLKGRN